MPYFANLQLVALCHLQSSPLKQSKHHMSRPLHKVSISTQRQTFKTTGINKGEIFHQLSFLKVHPSGYDWLDASSPDPNGFYRKYVSWIGF